MHLSIEMTSTGLKLETSDGVKTVVRRSEERD